MDRAVLQQFLAEAERHVALGTAHITRQRELIVELERDGHDSALARRVLRSFEEAQAAHLAHRDQLREELSKLSKLPK